MRLLTPTFVDHWAGRAINIHPSVLPAYPGLNTHQRAIDDGVRFAGCTVHFLSAEMDAGPIIAQATTPIMPEDTADTLAARVLDSEHEIYRRAIRWIAEGRVKIMDGRVQIDDVGSKASFYLPTAE
jgi:phosphoribosylglycinamide formyltransferase-1